MSSTLIFSQDIEGSNRALLLIVVQMIMVAIVLKKKFSTRQFGNKPGNVSSDISVFIQTLQSPGRNKKTELMLVCSGILLPPGHQPLSDIFYKMAWKNYGLQANITWVIYRNHKLGIIDCLKIARWPDSFYTQQKHYVVMQLLVSSSLWHMHACMTSSWQSHDINVHTIYEWMAQYLSLKL